MPYPSKTDPGQILETAIQILERDGREALSMRKLAEALGVQAPSLYRHYADKTTLEQAIAARAATQLHDVLQNAIRPLRSASKVLHQSARTYCAFAREHRELYDLMMTGFTPANVPEGKTLWNLVLEIIGRITGNPDDTAAAVALWSFLHGFVTLEQGGLFGPSGPRNALEVGIDALIVGLPNTRSEPRLTIPRVARAFRSVRANS
jgi:AcrR family transcriptional regulator